jgi:hypothetical protein
MTPRRLGSSRAFSPLDPVAVEVSFGAFSSLDLVRFRLHRLALRTLRSARWLRFAEIQRRRMVFPAHEFWPGIRGIGFVSSNCTPRSRTGAVGFVRRILARASIRCRFGSFALISLSARKPAHSAHKDFGFVRAIFGPVHPSASRALGSFAPISVARRTTARSPVRWSISSPC